MHAVPLPDMAEEENLSEKERLRRAEARLLPSQPPDADEAEDSSEPQGTAPSAPVLTYRPVPSDPLGREISQANMSSAPPLHPEHDTDRSYSLVPEYPGPREDESHPTDDKEELNRRRLEAERSAPGEDPDEPEESGPSASPGDATAGLEPSAPPLDDDAHGIGDGSEHSLPRYER